MSWPSSSSAITIGLALMFPSYAGYPNTDQGWMNEMLANGSTRMQTYGTWIANRYKKSPGSLL